MIIETINRELGIFKTEAQNSKAILVAECKRDLHENGIVSEYRAPGFMRPITTSFKLAIQSYQQELNALATGVSLDDIFSLAPRTGEQIAIEEARKLLREIEAIVENPAGKVFKSSEITEEQEWQDDQAFAIAGTLDDSRLDDIEETSRIGAN